MQRGPIRTTVMLWSGGPLHLACRSLHLTDDELGLVRRRVLALWVVGFGSRPGDRLGYRIIAPDGSIFLEEEQAETRSRPRFFRYVGRKRPPTGWAPGIWRSEVTLSRDGEQPVSLRREVELHEAMPADRDRRPVQGQGRDGRVETRAVW